MNYACCNVLDIGESAQLSPEDGNASTRFLVFAPKAVSTKNSLTTSRSCTSRDCVFSTQISTCHLTTIRPSVRKKWPFARTFSNSGALSALRRRCSTMLSPPGLQLTWEQATYWRLPDTALTDCEGPPWLLVRGAGDIEEPDGTERINSKWR